MKKTFIILFLFGLKSICLAQTYYFDSLIIGTYRGVLFQHDLADTTLISICNNDTLNINESIYPQAVYLSSEDSCWHTKGSGIIQYYSDTSFVRLPFPSCECFNGKYYGLNDSLKLKYFWLPSFNDRFFRFYGRKYWSPVIGWIGIKGKERIADINFDVYPNPSGSKTSIVFANGYLPQYRKGFLFDINGNEVMQFVFSESDASAIINTETLANGVYFVKVYDYGRMFVKRLVVAH